MVVPILAVRYEGRLRRHGFYSRNALALTATYVILIQRYYCPACKKTVSLLPSFLAPRFQYSIACIFFIFYQLAVRHLTFACIAERVNISSGRFEMSYQHIRFYRSRLFRNIPLITGFLGLKGIIIAEPDIDSWFKDFVHKVYRRFGLEAFSLEYFNFQARHFLNKR